MTDTIKGTDPHFIRCIKSNALNEAGGFDRQLVTEQLRYSGVIQVLLFFLYSTVVAFCHS